MRLNNSLNLTKLFVRVPIILRQSDFGLKPEFSLSIGRPDMDVHPLLLQGKEEESIASFSENSGTHDGT